MFLSLSSSAHFGCVQTSYWLHIHKVTDLSLHGFKIVDNNKRLLLIQQNNICFRLKELLEAHIELWPLTPLQSVLITYNPVMFLLEWTLQPFDCHHYTNPTVFYRTFIDVFYFFLITWTLFALLCSTSVFLMSRLHNPHLSPPICVKHLRTNLPH